MSKPKVLVVAGPTASGKSALGMALAEQVGGEIVCMDSMQIYRRMDIGTAKPTEADRAKIPHHLVDIREPEEPYSVAQYLGDAKAALADCLARGRVPILVGGTGFYLRALTHGLHLGGVPSDPELREKLKAEAKDAAGRTRLHDRLQAVDPISAKRLHTNDVTRVSRALEVYELTGKPLSALEQPAYDSPFAFYVFGTGLTRAVLYQRIDLRADRMMESGLLS
ncbi:MAG: tRNA (adenosine(37)-N6)-dimethylallyltransferase MiaA, partial [Firmicutes bacterium]|nr:tRNA (adenosine(37)-N6)-dimethylallyltransferase MiaA [Bacillota bacterium]